MDKYYQKLELDKIINIAEKYCITEIGKASMQNLKPSFNSLVVSHLLSETSQALQLINESGYMPIAPIEKFDHILKILSSDLSLTCSNLLSIAHLLKVSRALKKYFLDQQNTSSYDSIENYFNNLYINPSLEDTIFKSIVDENTLSDDASPELRSIRRKKQNIESSIKDI